MRIFLNYAKEDKDLVDKLYLKLVKSGFKTWMDKPPHPFQNLGIQPGERWRDALQDEIEKCDLFIACLSKISVQKKGFVQQEYRWALKQMSLIPSDEIYLLPLLLEEVEVPNLNVDSENFKNIQWYEYYSQGYDDLEAYLKAKMKPQGIVEISKKESIYLAASWTIDSDGLFKPNEYALKLNNVLQKNYGDKVDISLLDVSEGSFLIRQLYNTLDRATIGITVLTQDYKSVNGEAHPNSDVLIELGYLYSKLGPEKNLLIVEKGVQLPSNLSNMIWRDFTPANFESVFKYLYEFLGYHIH